MSNESRKFQTQIQPGKRVKVKTSAKYYSSGETNPRLGKETDLHSAAGEWEKGVAERNPFRVSSSDLQPSSSSVLHRQVGSRVRIKKDAKRYASGEEIPAWVKNQTYTIQQIKDSRVLLKEIQSWVFLKDIE